MAPPSTTSIGRPVKELKAFRKIRLEAHGSTEVSIEFDKVLSTSFWDEGRDKWCSEAGEYTVLVGTRSQDTPMEATFAVESTRYWKGLTP